ncbi:retrovirus-related Pol polyprotein from transposon opus [Nephila pilipes]|uniref:Retrovirus-related Pol polyprotein from transposon opus n=1 Tax=Nephila pilipes TaxID=299642 RepID=A0A8X6MG90_NEPPI|nr:retrovirus-related Pol polyprotein from transposon opus [Nephila pilipes]
MKNHQKRNIPVTAQSNQIQRSTAIKDDKSEVLTAKISIPVSKPVDIYDGVDDLKIVEIKCGKTILNGIVDTGVQISVVREDLVADMPYEGEGIIVFISEGISVLGKSETTPLSIFEMKINDNLHGDAPVTFVVSRRLTNYLLVSFSAYTVLKENIVLHGSSYFLETSNPELKVLNNNISGDSDYKGILLNITSTVLSVSKKNFLQNAKNDLSIEDTDLEF